MSVGVRTNQAASWNVPQGAGLGELYNQVLRQTGDANTAAEAVANAQRALDDLYHTTMVRTGGDQTASNAAVQQYSREVLRLAALLPSIQGSDTTRGSAALREAMGILDGVGINRTALYPWLKQNVASDDVLRSAGFDPAAVRAPADTPWAYADLDSLIALGRQMLENYVSPTGQRLTTDQIEQQLDAARTAARRLGVGEAFRPPATEAPAGTVTVAAFSFPRRV